MKEPKITIAVCAGCQQEKVIKSKGACAACYAQFKRTGSYVRDRLPRGMCTAEGCDKQAHGKGLCHMHIKRMKISGSLDDPRADNVNLMTNQQVYAQWSSYTRPDGYPIVPEWRDDFFAFMAAVGERPSAKHRLYRIDKTKPMGPGNFEWRERLVGRRADETDQEYNARHQRSRRVVHGSGMWPSDLMRRYGITMEQYKAMIVAQNNLCAICNNPETAMQNGIVKALAVEHDHRTNKVRALACQACNQMLGNARDSITRLLAGAAYLEKHGVIDDFAQAPFDA